jgi:hypothetical protein
MRKSAERQSFRGMHRGKLFMVESGPQEKDSRYSVAAAGRRKR